MAVDHLCREPEATERAGVRLGELVAPGTLIGLIGELGAGKTLLVQGLARGLGVPPGVRVTSPTFTLVNEYHGGRVALFHADLYRLERAEELDQIGLDDLCRGDGVVAVEWCDRFPVLAGDHLEIRIDVVSDGERRLYASGRGPQSAALAAAWAAALAST